MTSTFPSGLLFRRIQHPSGVTAGFPTCKSKGPLRVSKGRVRVRVGVRVRVRGLGLGPWKFWVRRHASENRLPIVQQFFPLFNIEISVFEGSLRRGGSED
jgi:hypothetical protein